jgi:hypothetical protein
MADERDTEQVNETNTDNDAREEDIVSDTDADTRDVEETQQQDFDATERRFSSIEATLDKILGAISSLREAQGIMVENGAVVNDVDSDIGHDEEDEFVPPREMDLLI